jgi:hypothetical protein
MPSPPHGFGKVCRLSAQHSCSIKEHALLFWLQAQQAVIDYVSQLFVAAIFFHDKQHILHAQETGGACTSLK